MCDAMIISSTVSYPIFYQIIMETRLKLASFCFSREVHRTSKWWLTQTLNVVMRKSNVIEKIDTNCIVLYTYVME